jgi:hypothetical protein
MKEEIESLLSSSNSSGSMRHEGDLKFRTMAPWLLFPPLFIDKKTKIMNLLLQQLQQEKAKVKKYLDVAKKRLSGDLITICVMSIINIYALGAEQELATLKELGVGLEENRIEWEKRVHAKVSQLEERKTNHR